MRRLWQELARYNMQKGIRRWFDTLPDGRSRVCPGKRTWRGDRALILVLHDRDVLPTVLSQPGRVHPLPVARHIIGEGIGCIECYTNGR